MSAPWPFVSLGELIRLERRPVDVIAEREYQEIGTYSHGRGIFRKKWPAPGSEDTELGVLMGPEVSHGATKVYAGIQA